MQLSLFRWYTVLIRDSKKGAKMSRTIGAKNKETTLPAVYSLTAEQRIQMLVSLLVEMLTEEVKCSPNL